MGFHLWVTLGHPPGAMGSTPALQTHTENTLGSQPQSCPKAGALEGYGSRPCTILSFSTSQTPLS